MNHATGTGKYELLLERCRALDPIPTAVAHPCEETALAGAIDAAAKGLITPILVGPAQLKSPTTFSDYVTKNSLTLTDFVVNLITT